MCTTYSIRSNRLIATFDPDGARIRSLHLDKGANLVLDVDDAVSQDLRDAYGGVIVGPLANRVRRGQVPLGDTVYQMPWNENGTTALHSGPNGLDRVKWTVVAQDRTALHLRHHLPDGDGGLPGNRDIELWFEVLNNTLTLRVTMTTDAPTPVSIAHHPYWRVTPEHKLRIQATHYLPTDHANLPTGAMAPVADTPFDHRTARPIDPGTDHNFCIADAPRSAPAPVATLTTPTHILEIASTEPGLQVYSGAFLPKIPETSIAPLAGVALEPQGWPDAVNHPNFPNVICTPDHPYSQVTQYTLQPAT
ncbi:aldose 1-epimerase [Tateyamaria omphalii]|uniref:aldose epimerase family protein n=1 Tax=Tateyamaria omphalii TaxID=299262 RepID=UPI0016766CC8|nr:aldose epimerase family protein [Tateyamaria omphalii]GGX46088.1 aldose 1-epimerase [Tateyamaria omphalii]